MKRSSTIGRRRPNKTVKSGRPSGWNGGTARRTASKCRIRNGPDVLPSGWLLLFVWSVWFVWFVLFIWLNQTNRINQMNQINQFCRALRGRKILCYILSVRPPVSLLVQGSIEG